MPASTFKPRRRRLSPRRADLLDRLGPSYLFAESGSPLTRADLGGSFGRTAPVVLEIGFGSGDSLVAMAAAEPDLDVVGADVHTPGIARVLDAIESDGLTNVRLVHGDALVFLDRLAPGTLHAVRVFFPDPWPKVRQHHRRLVRPDVVAALAERLLPGGVLHLATDVADYAEQMRAVCGADPRLVALPAAEVPWRTPTRYEAKGADAGRAAVDLAYRRR